MNEPVRVLELRSVSGTGGGPDKTILLGTAETDPERYAITLCYLRNEVDEKYTIDRKARELGLDYVEIRERSSVSPATWTRLREIVREGGYHIVHAHDYKTDLLAFLLGRQEDVIPLATVHGWSGVSARERFYYWADRKFLTRFPMTIAVSGLIRDTLIEHGADPQRVRHIPNAIDPQAFRPDPQARARARAQLGIPEGALVVGAVGRLAEEKRFDLLLDAVAGMPERLPVHILIVGEGSCREELVAQARALGLEDRLHLPGFFEDVRDAHQALDVYVQTSDTEGVPNAVLEAMALETPVIATDVGGTDELITNLDTGLLVAKGDAPALTRCIVQVLEDREGAAQRVANARRRIEEELTFQRRREAVEKVYDELMELRAARQV